MRTVWKFPLVTVEQRITAPGLNRLLCVGNQGHQGHVEVCVWGEVDTMAEPRSSVVSVHGTGHEVAADEHYIGTFFDGPLVWHAFATEPTS